MESVSSFQKSAMGCDNMSPMKCSIIIPTKDRNCRLWLVLKALEHQVDPSVEVIIVMDGCCPETIREFDGFTFSYQPRKIIARHNVGRAAARNLGLNHAKGEIVIFLDDDRIPAPDFIAKHLAGHRKHCVLIGERKEVNLSEAEIELFSSSGGLGWLVAVYQSAYVELFNDMTKKVLLHPLSYFRWLGLATGNVSIAKKDLDRVGAFDGNFVGWGYEDIELGYRLFREGIPFIKDSSIVNYHLVHKHSPNKSAEEYRNISYFLKKIKGDIISRMVLKLLRLRLNIRVIFKTYI